MSVKLPNFAAKFVLARIFSICILCSICTYEEFCTGATTGAGVEANGLRFAPGEKFTTKGCISKLMLQ